MSVLISLARSKDSGMNFWPPFPGSTDIKRIRSTFSIYGATSSIFVFGLMDIPAKQPKE